MTTHVFVVDDTTFKYHLEYLFAGTGAKDKTALFLNNPSVNSYPSATERMLVGMIADISRIRIGDKVVFYLQATQNHQGMFFGIFKVASVPFFDENDNDNYLLNEMHKGLSFRILLETDVVYSLGVTEHEYLDSLIGKNHPYDLNWSLIYRKLKGNRGCTMIMDYEYDDLLSKLLEKNSNTPLYGNAFTFDEVNCKIIRAEHVNAYQGRQNPLNITSRLIWKANRKNSFEAHLQAYIMQNFDKPNISNLLLQPLENSCIWIGNEVSCGVGMQRIDIMIKQENSTDVYIRLIELKDDVPYVGILNQISWYLEWISDYVVAKYLGKNIHLIPTIIANGILGANLCQEYQNFRYPVNNIDVHPLQYIGFKIENQQLIFNQYL